MSQLGVVAFFVYQSFCVPSYVSYWKHEKQNYLAMYAYQYMDTYIYCVNVNRKARMERKQNNATIRTIKINSTFLVLRPPCTRPPSIKYTIYIMSTWHIRTSAISAPPYCPWTAIKSALTNGLFHVHLLSLCSRHVVAIATAYKYPPTGMTTEESPWPERKKHAYKLECLSKLP